jgi:molybdate transport system permease protein
VTAPLDVVLRVTLAVAGLAAVLAMTVAIPFAYLVARRDFPGKALLSALLVLPMVLPPTAVGALLLLVLADRGPLGRATLGVDLGGLFTWRAAVLASTVMALPICLRTARVAFESVDPRLESMARTLGLGPLRTFARVTLPLASRGLGAAALLGFLRAMGEFGATMMVAGNIPGETQTLALAIFSAGEAGRDREALGLIGVAVVVGLVALLLAERWARASSPPPSREARASSGSGRRGVS